MTSYLTSYGYGFLFLVIFIESTGAPVPGESLVIAGGMLSAKGTFSIAAVIGAAALGAIAGDNLSYLVGRRFGRRMVVRWGSRFGLGEKRFAMVEDRFQRYGFAIVLVARFVIILRQLNGFVAGTMHMPWPMFFLYNAISAFLWAAAYGGAAWVFGAAFEHFFQTHSTWLILAISAGICLVGCVTTYQFLFSEDSRSDRASVPSDPNERSEEASR